MDMANRELVKTWKVQVTAAGVILTMNGKEYELGASVAPMVFDLARAAGPVPEPVDEPAAVALLRTIVNSDIYLEDVASVHPWLKARGDEARRLLGGTS